MKRRQNTEIWGLKVVGYLFLAGLGAGSIAIAAALDLNTNGQARALTLVGACMALLGVGIGSLLLLADLGVPLRAFRLVGNKSSLISIGSVILSSLLVLAFITVLVGLFSTNAGTLFTVLLVADVVLALAGSLYIGFLLAVVKCRPFWNTPLLPLLFVMSSLSTGVAMLTLVASIGGAIGYAISVPEQIAGIETILLTVELLMVASYVITMENSLPQARSSVRRLISGDLAMMFWTGVVLAGLVLPLGLQVVDLTATAWVAAVLVLIGGFSLRYTFLFAGVRALLPGEARAAAMLR